MGDVGLYLWGIDDLVLLAGLTLKWFMVKYMNR